MIQDEPGFIDLAAGSAAARREESAGVHAAADRRASGSVRSLPSGPAPSWVGLALSLVLLSLLAAALTVGLSGWLVVSLFIRAGKLAKGAGR